MQENEIIDLCQQWELNFFWELYEKYFDKIYKYIYLKTYNIELTQDITSQVFLKALDKINSFKNDNDSNFKAWLYRIAHNLVVDNYKKADKTLSMDSILEPFYIDNLQNNIDNKEQLKNIFSYFNSLNLKHKEVLILRIWEDLPFKDISKITTLSESNCKKIVSRTLKNLPEDLLITIFLLLISNIC